MHRLFFVIAALGLVAVAGGCARHGAPPLSGPGEVLPSRFPAVTLERYLALGEPERKERAGAADRDFQAVRFHRTHLEELAKVERYSSDIHGNTAAFAEDVRDERVYDGLIRKMHRATSVDPTFTEAWWVLGDLLALVGDPRRGLEACQHGLEALAHDPREPEVDGLEGALRVTAAWCCRELGYPDRGLRGLDDPAADLTGHAREACLVRGLLLADAGRFGEAWDVAVSLEAAVYPHVSWGRLGFGTTTSAYQRRWIQAMTWLGRGDAGMARHALGPLMMTKGGLPFMRRFWHDAGLVCELAGEIDEAVDCYALSLVGDRIHLPYIPWEAYSSPPVIAGAPDVRLPFFTVFESNRLTGSLFSFATQLMIDTANSADPEERDHAAERAVEAFSVCIRRGIHPDLALALRGRTRYYAGDAAGAEQDLRSACDRLAATGREDAGTLMVLGSLLLTLENAAEAESFLARAVVADPGMAGAWRLLGAARAVRGGDEALDALDRAVALEPGSSSGWYNRGLFHANAGRWGAALTDLDVASRLAPWNARATALLQRAARELRDEGRGDELATATARAEELAAANPVLRRGGLDARPETVVLDQVRKTRAVRVDPAEFAARADALAEEYERAPSPELRRRLVDACLRAGRDAEAAALLADSWTGAEALPDLLLHLRAERAGGSADRARDLAGRIGEEGLPRDPELWSLVALNCLDAGLEEPGRRALELAIALDPGNEGLRLYRNFLHGRKAP